MSLRCWNSSYERQQLQLEIRLFHCTLQLVHLYGLDDDSDDSRVSSSSSSSFSMSVDSHEDLDNDDDDDDDELDPLPAMAEHLLKDATRVWKKIEDENIAFGQRMLIADFTESDCITNFRFRKDDLVEVADELWPRIEPFLLGDRNNLTVDNNYHAPYETCLLVYLWKMSFPRRLISDMEKTFGMRKSHLSAIIQSFSASLFLLAHQYLIDPRIWHGRMPYYANLVASKSGGLFTNIWGFIDGSIRKTCRPYIYQDLLWTKYKKCHGIKFQNVTVPDGFIACLHGPFVAKRHDARMLRESGLMDILRDLMPADGSNGPVYAMYGDLAYPQSVWLLGGIANAEQGSLEARLNKFMSKSRISVEWSFNEIVKQWGHLDWKRSMKVFKEPIARHYMNGAFLCNLRNCFYGNETTVYFGVQEEDKLKLNDYLALID